MKNVQIWSEDLFFSQLATIRWKKWSLASEGQYLSPRKEGFREINIKKKKIKKYCTALAACYLELKLLHRDFLMHQERNMRKDLNWRICKVMFAVGRKVFTAVWFPSLTIYIFFVWTLLSCTTSYWKDNLQNARSWQLQNKIQKDLLVKFWLLPSDAFLIHDIICKSQNGTTTKDTSIQHCVRMALPKNK